MKTELKFISALNSSIEFKIGQNAQDNFDIIDESNPNDLWFHLYGESSCHVIAMIDPEVKLDKKQKRQIITQGALLCKTGRGKLNPPCQCLEDREYQYIEFFYNIHWQFTTSVGQYFLN